jgi:hypothetical protein
MVSTWTASLHVHGTRSHWVVAHLRTHTLRSWTRHARSHHSLRSRSTHSAWHGRYAANRLVSLIPPCRVGSHAKFTRCIGWSTDHRTTRVHARAGPRSWTGSRTESSDTFPYERDGTFGFHVVGPLWLILSVELVRSDRGRMLLQVSDKIGYRIIFE